MVLVQNKVDLIEKAVVTSEEVESLAKKLKVKLYRTCVSENLNVDKVFEYLGEEYVNGGKGGGESESGIPSINDIGSTMAGKKSDSGGAPAAPSQPKRDMSGNGGDGASKKEAKDAKKDIVSIEAKPKQRTGGKKKFACTIL
jgi:hypothetical protein